MTKSVGSHKIVVLIPCYNEEVTISKVIQDFQRELPEAEIIVFDNNSIDNTAKISRELGATVIEEKRQGKGYVIASMFEKIDADYYLMVDGDDTYSAEHARQLLEPLISGTTDMTVGTRLSEYTTESFRPLHVFGNNLVRSLVNWIFKNNLSDIMSGYRGYTRKLAKSIPVMSSGFEVETELTIRVLDYGFSIIEIPTPYKERPEGSFSKLHTFRDGFRVIQQIVTIAKAYKPFTFFGSIALFLAVLGTIFGIEVLIDFLEDHFVHKVPTAILASGCMILCFGSLGIGIILNTLNYRYKEIMKLLQRALRK